MTKEQFEEKYPFILADKYGVAFYVLKSKSFRTGKVHIGYYKNRAYAQSKKNCFQEQVLVGYDCHNSEIYRKYFYGKFEE